MPGKRSDQRRQRGDGSLFLRGDGMWVGSIDLGTGGDGKRRRRTVSSKDYATAVAKLRALNRARDDGALPTERSTTKAWLDRWLTEIVQPRVKPRTYDDYASVVTHYLTPNLGAHRLDALAPQHIRDLHRTLTTGPTTVSASTAHKAHRVLAKALNDAIREGILARNVATLVDAPRRTPTTQTALTADQARTLLTHAVATRDPLATRWAAALLTGARQGELIGLEWHRLDLDAGTLDISWQLQRLTHRHGCTPPCGHARASTCPQARVELPAGFEARPLVPGLYLTRPKSHAGVRLVPLVPVLADVLRHHRDNPGRPHSPHGLVWTQSDGSPLTPDRDYRAWKAALAAAGLQPIPLHGTRHTAATLLLEAGVDTHVIASIVGHSSIVVTRGYQHVSLDHAREGLGALSALLPGTPADVAADAPAAGQRTRRPRGRAAR
jgi:integrase